MTQEFLNSQKEKAIIALSKFKWNPKQESILRTIAQNGKIFADVVDTCGAFGFTPNTIRNKSTCILVGNPNKKKSLFVKEFNWI